MLYHLSYATASGGKCLRWGSNPRPWDYETHALPTAPQRLAIDYGGVSRLEILLCGPEGRHGAGYWLKFSTSNHLASVYTSRAQILPPVQERLTNPTPP